MSEALYRDVSSEEIVTAPGPNGYASGQIVLAPSGKAGVVQGLKPVAAGDPATLSTMGRFEIQAATAAVIAAGAKVDWHATNRHALAHGSGTFTLGIASRAKANGETTIMVLLNDPGPTPTDED